MLWQKEDATKKQEERGRMDEAETCREYVRPGLEAAGWDDEAHPILGQKR